MRLDRLRIFKLPVGVLCAVLVCAAAASPSAAATATPALVVRTVAKPTYIPAEGSGVLTVLVTNPGGAPTNGEPVTLNDAVPQGLVVTEVSTLKETPNEAEGLCKHTTTTVTCVYAEQLPGESAAGLRVEINVTAEAGVEGPLTNTAAVSGGGALPVSRADVITVGHASEEPPFGFDEPLEAGVFDASGAIDTQAGDHPASDTTGFVLNSIEKVLAPGNQESVQELKDVSVQLPLGFVGNPQAAPTCPEYLIAPPGDGVQCPAASVVGSVAVQTQFPRWEVSGPANSSDNVKPLFNVAPERGYPAEFAFIFENQEAILYAHLVHTGAGYVIRVTSSNIVPAAKLTGVKATFFGDPAAQDNAGTTPTAFFTNPTDCSTGPQVTTIHIDSYQDPGRLNGDGSPDLSDPAWKSSESSSPPLSGCERLQFNPEVSVLPTTRQSNAPTGLEVNLKIPQNNDPTGLGTPELKNATVTLPRGLSISPPSADGLQGCSNAQIALESTAPSSCPQASAIGSVTVHTPLLNELLEGQVFLGEPECSPCSSADAQDGRMVRLFIEVADPARGVDVKLPGTVSVGTSGQLSATFKESPQLPFDHLEFHFKSGPRAPLVTPTACGTYSSTADFTPWSTPYTDDAVLNPSFEVTEGCSSASFAPGFAAGTANNRAGAFSPFTTTFSRSDQEQGLADIQVQVPPGLLGMLSSVPLCGEAQANAGTCPAASQIGHTVVTAGAGSDPLTVPQPGQPQAPVYLTTGYRGAPFGLSVVVPAIAGPFNLGTVVVRAAIAVDPHTAQVTITSDPLPRILDGIPLQIRTVGVTVDRPGFMFNPTSCRTLSIGGSVTSIGAATAPLATRFQASDCASLPFKPSFTAATAGRSSKASGASLDVKVAAKGGPQQGGGEANIREVKVDLPIQLPSRLSTLNKACLAAVFAANPAACPKESDVGTATAHTPVLANALSGPAYLVSYGGAKFPDLEIVLQGEGIVLILDGQTNIKKGVTSSQFSTVPDAPISSFELKLPTGKFSVLAANLPAKTNFNFCGQTLSMPTKIVAQTGAVIKQTTKIAVTGCPKAKTTVKKKKTNKNARKAGKAAVAGRRSER